MMAWLSAWGKVQVCIWPSWCHCHSPIHIGFTFLVPAHLVVPDKELLNGWCCCCCCCCWIISNMITLFGLKQWNRLYVVYLQCSERVIQCHARVVILVIKTRRQKYEFLCLLFALKKKKLTKILDDCSLFKHAFLSLSLSLNGCLTSNLWCAQSVSWVMSKLELN